MTESTDVDVVIEPMSVDDARKITDSINRGAAVVWKLVTQAYERRAWVALGYDSWDDYCASEFGTGRIAIPREDRHETIASLRESGLSVRAIASVTGESKSSIGREVSHGGTVDADGFYDEGPESDPWTGGETVTVTSADVRDAFESEPVDAEVVEEPATVTGLDGKQHPASKPNRPTERRKPLVDTGQSLAVKLRKQMDSFTKLIEDDRYKRNRKALGDAIRGDLIYARDTLDAILSDFPEVDQADGGDES